MAQISESGGSGKRSLNPDINLVPFIDLLSVCICFLLISAVWLQVGSIQVKQAYGTDAEDAPKETFDIDIGFVDAFGIKLLLKQKNQTVLALDIKSDTRDGFKAAVNDNLEATIAKLRGAHVGGETLAVPDLIASATITPAKVATYEALVTVMDALRKHQIVNLAVIPKAG